MPGSRSLISLPGSATVTATIDGVGISPEMETVLPEEQTLQFTIRTVVFRFCTDQTTDLLIPASPTAAQKSKYEYLQKRRPLKKRSPF